MRLERIEIAGFKSFSDLTELYLDHIRITSLALLRGLRLTSLGIEGTGVSDLFF